MTHQSIYEIMNKIKKKKYTYLICTYQLVNKYFKKHGLIIFFTSQPAIQAFPHPSGAPSSYLRLYWPPCLPRGRHFSARASSGPGEIIEVMLPIDVWRNQQKPPSEAGIRSTIQSYIQTIIKLSSLFWLSEKTAIDPTNPLAPNPILGQRHQELLFQRLAVKQPTSSDSGVIVVLKGIPKITSNCQFPSTLRFRNAPNLWSQAHPRCFPRKPPHNQTTPPPWCYVPRTSSNFWSHAPWRIAFPTDERIKKMSIQERTTILANSFKKEKALKLLQVVADTDPNLHPTKKKLASVPLLLLVVAPPGQSCQFNCSCRQLLTVRFTAARELIACCQHSQQL